MDTKIIGFRALGTEDRDRLFHWRNQADVRRYMYNDRPIAAEDHARWFAGLEGNPTRHDRIILFNDVPVGLASFYDIRLSARTASWAYYLADPSLRGQGAGACVEYLMIETAFGDMALEKLWCEVLINNEAVWKLHQAFGFVIEAHFRRHVIRSDGAQDVYGLGLLRDDWQGLRDNSRARLTDRGFIL